MSHSYLVSWKTVTHTHTRMNFLPRMPFITLQEWRRKLL